MNTIKAIRTNDNNASSSRAINFMGVQILGNESPHEPLNGEHRFKFDEEEEDTVCRFVNGYLDGNVYDKEGKIIEKRPALEYGFGGTEFWTKGYPDGIPAVLQNFGYYEEDWKDGNIVEIRNEVELLSIE